MFAILCCFEPSKHSLTNNCALIVLVWVEATMLFVWRQVVVWLLNHVVAVGDLALLEGALVDVDVGVVLQIHYSRRSR